MLERRAQIGTEYLIVTGFILLIVVVIFGFAFVNQDQSIKTSQANTLLDTLANKADYVYALGQGNSQIAIVTIPSGIQQGSMGIVHKCTDGSQTLPGGTCPGGDSGIDFSAIQLAMGFFSGQATLTRTAKGPLSFENDDDENPFPCSQDASFCQGRYKIRVYWQQGQEKVSLKRVD